MSRYRGACRGGLNFDGLAFTPPSRRYLSIGGEPWSMETALLFVKNLFVTDDGRRVSVSCCRTRLARLGRSGEELESCVFTTFSVFGRTVEREIGHVLDTRGMTTKGVKI